MIIERAMKQLSIAHRIPGHAGKCKYLHGHNYDWSISVEGDKLDDLGMVIDFGAFRPIQEWFDTEYDHKTLLWNKDPLAAHLQAAQMNSALDDETKTQINGSLVLLPYIPTVENLASHWLRLVQEQLKTVRVVAVKLFETANCSAIAVPPTGK